MIAFDFKCTRCPVREERWVPRHNEPQTCRCGEPMAKLPPPTKTTFRFADKQ
jgi:hypothetical protein